MPSIITAANLRSILGVSSTLFDDDYLNEIINTAENLILPMLETNVSGISHYWLSGNVAYFRTIREHSFIAGQSVVVTGLPAPFSATHTVTLPTSNIGSGYKHFAAGLTNADVVEREVSPAGVATLSGSAAGTIYATNAGVISAVKELSVQVFRSRTAPDGSSDGADFQPFVMGKALFSKIKGLIAGEIDTDAMVQ